MKLKKCMLKMAKILTRMLFLFIDFIILCIFCPIYDMSFLAYFLYTNDNKVVGTIQSNRMNFFGRSISYGRKNIPEMV